jgi:general L-amino acid transport system permease protein
MTHPGDMAAGLGAEAERLWRALRVRLFPTPVQSAVSVVLLLLLARVVYGFVDWALLSAVFRGESGAACRVPDAGACWPFVTHKMSLFLYGRYPEAELWRVHLTLGLALGGLAPLLSPGVPHKRALALYMLVAFPVLATLLLSGGVLGLEWVPTELWGGLLLTLVIASVGIATSFPLGILLALARRSELPLVRWTAAAYIELVRGVPLVTVLFMASVMLPLFLPPDITIDKLVRALVGVSLFSAAYVAEVIRGGLQAIPRGQYEAADALGLGTWRKMLFIVLPQALRLVIPGLVNSFISLFKDTSLVLIIGLFDLTGIIQQSVQADAQWFTPQTAATGYFFAGLVFWLFCFAMSRWSAALEASLQRHNGR